MGKILEKLMKKYWKNAKNTGKVYEKILEKCKKKKLEKSGKFVSPKKWEPCSISKEKIVLFHYHLIFPFLNCWRFITFSHISMLEM